MLVKKVHEVYLVAQVHLVRQVLPGLVVSLVHVAIRAIKVMLVPLEWTVQWVHLDQKDKLAKLVSVDHLVFPVNGENLAVVERTVLKVLKDQ